MVKFIFKDILKAVPELGGLELYILESKIKKEWEKRNALQQREKPIEN